MNDAPDRPTLRVREAVLARVARKEAAYSVARDLTEGAQGHTIPRIVLSCVSCVANSIAPIDRH